MADPKLAQALRLKAQARLRLQQSEGGDQPPPVEDTGYQPAAPTTADTGWWETLGNTARNTPGSAVQVVKDLAHAVTHPAQVAESIRQLDVGSRQWLESLAGDHPQETPEMATSRKFAENTIEGLKHPVTTFSNDPVGVMMNILGGKGLLGKGLKIAEAPTDLGRLVEKTRMAKDAAYETTNKLPTVKSPTLINETRAAADKAGYDPANFPAHAAAYPGLQHVTSWKKGDYFDPGTLRNMRVELERRGEGTGGDSGLLEKTKAAFDSEVAKASPAVADAMMAEREAYGLYKNTRGLSDMLTSGKLRGALRGENASEIKKNITRTLTNARAKKGYGDIEENLTKIVETTPNSVGLMKAMLTQSGASASALAALGAHVAGLPGAMVGGFAGAAIPPATRLAQNARAARVVERELTNLIREINGLPPAQRTLRIKQLSPAKRLMLLNLAAASGQSD